MQFHVGYVPPLSNGFYKGQDCTLHRICFWVHSCWRLFSLAQDQSWMMKTVGHVQHEPCDDCSKTGFPFPWKLASQSAQPFHLQLVFYILYSWTPWPVQFHVKYVPPLTNGFYKGHPCARDKSIGYDQTGTPWRDCWLKTTQFPPWAASAAPLAICEAAFAANVLYSLCYSGHTEYKILCKLSNLQIDVRRFDGYTIHRHQVRKTVFISRSVSATLCYS